MSIGMIVQAILAALSAAPSAVALANKVKELFTELFNAGLITKEQQDALHARVDADVTLFKTGLVPSWWQVEPDPKPASSQSTNH